MKKIIYTTPEGLLAVVHPAEGARLAHYITLADGTVLPKGADTAQGRDPFTADSIFRAWPVAGATATWAEKESEFVARIAAKDVPADALDVHIVEGDAIPADRTFRNAWKSEAGRIVHDTPKCREIQRNKLRELRKPKLAALDIAFMRALETGAPASDVQEIVAKKQALRDVTADPRLEAANTPDELRAVVPEVLR